VGWLNLPQSSKLLPPVTAKHRVAKWEGMSDLLKCVITGDLE